MTKKIILRKKPSRERFLRNPDLWVSQQALPRKQDPALKRLTINIPKDLHARFKRECLEQGYAMCAVLIHLIEETLSDSSGG